MRRFGEKMRALRHKHGMSVRQLATALDYHGHSRISEIETGKRVPTVAFVLQVAAFFHVTTDQLLQDDLDIEGVTGPTATPDDFP